MSPLAALLFAALTLALTVLGAVLAVAGRVPGAAAPSWPREGWPMRVWGIPFFLIGAALTALALNGGAAWDAVVVGYFFAGLTLWRLYGRSLSGRLRLR